ncbi:ABC transporter permease [Mesonia sp. HuA40]|uniref:ABC transporter permease n=1 Tax=Mesonia sp. HuA40 TaxID=2602761 RepID=UPI0011C9B45E|nr:ABC transporter permease [Mesonia sp. HuA40]TXK71598.1 ABC transporter permease [Mesonia sp. HuA40]
MQYESGSPTKMALQKFKSNFWGVFCLIYIMVIGFMALFAYVIAPDSSVNANTMNLSIHSQPPGFQVEMLILPQRSGNHHKNNWEWLLGEEDTPQQIPFSRLKIEENEVLVYPYKKDAQTSLGLPQRFELSRFNGLTNLEAIQEAFVKKHTFLLGTDKYGRDLFSRLLVGSRISLSIGFVAVFISLIIGLSLGALAGYFGGFIDATIMWLINVMWSIPTLLLVIAITLALGKGFWQVFIAVGLTMWVEVARVVRGQVMGVKKLQYITAAKALGYSHSRVILKHILPQVIAPLIVISAANFAAAILIESGLSFLGIGAQPPTPSWGGMIKDHYSYILLGKPYLALVPGLAIMSLVMAFMLIGNALRDALDVKT